MNDWNKLRNSLKESIASPTNSQYGSPVISEYRIPRASHSILSFFPPNYDSSSGGSASNETPPRLSHSIMSLFPPTWSQNESSRSDESLPPFFHSIPSLFPPNWSQSESSRSDESLPPFFHSIPSLFPPNWSQSERSRFNESLPPFSHSIPSIFPPTQSETESSESNERLITRSSHSKQSIFPSNKSDTTSSDSIHIYSPSPSYGYCYSFELIRSATHNFLAKTYTSTSSTRSWRCTLQGKNAIVFQRKLRRKMGLRQLTQCLSVTYWAHDHSIIPLLGASVSGDHIYLVYDFVDGANLANCLRNPNNPNFTVLATWISRMQIALDLAHGLAYIHGETSTNNIGSLYVHNHIKSSSIIVTESSFNAKICHIGTAQLCEEIDESEAHKDSEIQEEEAVGGCRPPEFQGSGIVTQKCDVYAFGVVILELLSGEEPLKYKDDKATGDVVRTSVIETAAAVIEEGDDRFGPEYRLRFWVDRRLNDSFPVDVAEKLIRLALDCVHLEPDKRPNMTSVASKISDLYLQSKAWSDKFSGVKFNYNFPPTQSETECSESNETLITRSSDSIQSTSSDSIHIYSPSSSDESLYPYDMIRYATKNFLAKTYTSTSSTRSWHCTILRKKVIVFQRKFRCKMRMLQLTQRLWQVTGRSHHSSIIKFLDASVLGDHIYLVYDSVDGPNLANCLRNPNNPNFTVLATWISRMQIAMDLAHGLAHIHSNLLVHNHIKSSTIIVRESSFNAKICDIGTAQLCGEIDESEAHKDSEIQEEEAIGGCRSPEFQGSGIVTQKCDVYAFGVVILELLSGEEPLKYKDDKATGDVVRTSVIETAAAVIEEGDDRFGPEYRLRFWVDRRLNDSFPVEVAEKLIRLALDCVHVEPDKRPNMTSVAWKISDLYLQSKLSKYSLDKLN